jgi:sRNA-binding regulator protein Hfq
MQIVNGITADAGWTKQLAYSHDGSTWKTLNKSHLRVETGIVNGNTNSPLVSSSQSYVVMLMHGDETMLRFKLSDVSNQAGWTLNAAGLTQAVDDLNTWIAT